VLSQRFSLPACDALATRFSFLNAFGFPYSARQLMVQFVSHDASVFLGAAPDGKSCLPERRKKTAALSGAKGLLFHAEQQSLCDNCGCRNCSAGPGL